MKKFNLFNISFAEDSFPTTTERIRWPIRVKITLPFLILTIIIALGATVLFSRIVLETVDERFSNQLYESGKLASGAMVTLEERQLETLRLLTNTEGFAEAVQKYDAERLRKLALGIVVNNQPGSVEILDLSANLVLAIRQKQAGNNQDYIFVQGGTPIFQDWPIVQNVLAMKSDPAGNKFASFIKTDWGKYFYISGPIRDPAGTLIGVILVGVPLSSVTSELRLATLAQVTIYDFEGQLLTSTFPDANKLEPVKQEMVNDILVYQDSTSYRRNFTRRDLTSSGLNYGEIIGPWEARDGKDLGLLGTALVKNVLVSASLPTRAWIAALIFITAIMVIMLGVALSTMLTRPLLKLMEASKQVAGGNLKVQLQQESNDEIGVVATSFNTMVRKLQQSHDDMVATYDSTLEGWAKALELRDKETSGHTVRVTKMTLDLCRRIHIPEAQLVHIRRGTTLHDIGKMGIPDHILLKPGKLTPAEWELMRLHPIYAYDMLKNIPYLVPALDIPYCHHERWDGAGYPRQLKGEEIPLASRLFSIVDAWDAMTSDRPYHDKISSREALAIILSEGGRQFDPKLVKVFADYIESTILRQS